MDAMLYLFVSEFFYTSSFIVFLETKVQWIISIIALSDIVKSYINT